MRWKHFWTLWLIIFLTNMVACVVLNAEQTSTPRFHFVQRDQIDASTYVLVIKDTVSGACYAHFTTLGIRSLTSSTVSVLCARPKGD